MYSTCMKIVEDKIADIVRLYNDHGLTQETIDSFKALVEFYYSNYGRDLPWRKTNDPYHIFVSEVMLQQTQVDRVEPKYLQWIHELPNFSSLATCSFDTVLRLWHGLGYNRRALNLQRAAQIITEKHNGIVPSNPEILATLPGIGKATAASIACYAYNAPVVFLETNIRTVYITLFFPDTEKVDDKDIAFFLELTMDITNPSRWYNALMDLGTYLKKTRPNPTRSSRVYRVQSPFHGSKRKVRGQVLSLLLEYPRMHLHELQKHITDERLYDILSDLKIEGLIKESKGMYFVGEKEN